MGDGDRHHRRVTVFVVMIGSVVGWLINVFTGSGGSSDFDTKDPADDFY